MQLVNGRVRTMYFVQLVAAPLGLKKLHLQACRSSLDIGVITGDHPGNQGAQWWARASGVLPIGLML